jgi:hypothetical protein
MQIIIKTEAKELQRARQWWNDLETQWKTAYNEAVFGKGPSIEPPKDDELMILLVSVDTLRFAGPLAISPNMSTQLTNLSGLIPLYQLRFLSISNTHIRSVKELQRHTRLCHLFLYENQLESLEGIEEMSELEELYVQHNRLKDIDPVKNLNHLRTLYVSDNELRHLRGLNQAHGDSLKKFYVFPNDSLPGKEIIRIQNEFGIICRTG